MSAPATPPGWPPGLPPPGAPGWQRRVVGWLLDACPPDYRDYDVLLRHPVVLARFAATYVEAAAAAATHGLATLRADLREAAEPPVVEAAVAAYQREQARLQVLARQVAAVEQALRRPR